jgi:hypothetical protein
MVVDKDLLRSAAGAASIFKEAENHFDDAFRSFLMSVEPMDFDDPKVAKITKYIRKDMDRPYRHDSKTSMFEVVRSSLRGYDFDYMDIMAFSRLHINLKNEMYKPLFDVISGRGDDSYGDLLDALILAGPAVVKRIISGSYREGENDRVEEDIRTAVEKSGESEKVTKSIIHGENYVGMFLEDGLKEYFFSYLREVSRSGDVEHPWFRIAEKIIGRY